MRLLKNTLDFILKKKHQISGSFIVWKIRRWGHIEHSLDQLQLGMILGLGRAIGETMAVTMLIGNTHDISASLFAPGYTMASLIANEFSEASDDLHLAALMAVGFALLVITLLVNALARWLVWRVGRDAIARIR